MVRFPKAGFGLQVVCLLAMAWAAVPGRAAQAGAYPETTRALQERYVDEVRAHRQYGAYARRAMQDGYPNIAHLFRALSMSEAVHARNFRALLQELGAETPSVIDGFTVGSTRENLKRATTVEAQEIDKEYPEILDRIRPEGHQRAIQSITWAWQAEQQHRELILKIRKAATYFFGMLVRRIEDKPTHYYVCQVCGSTLTEIPAHQCPICGSPVEDYLEIPGFKAPVSKTPSAPDK